MQATELFSDPPTPFTLTMDGSATTRSLESTIAAEIQADFLTCSICNLPFSKPKALPCLHTFCRGCLAWHLQQHTIKASAGVYCIFCPTCKQVIDVPTSGIDGFPDNDLLKKLLDTINLKSQQKCGVCGPEAEEEELAKLSTFCCIKCEDFMCRECADGHKRTPSTKDHLLVHIASMKEACQSLRTQNMYKVTVRQLGSFGREGDDLHDPTSIGVTGSDEIIVSNGNSTLCIFSQSGKLKKTIDQTKFCAKKSKDDTSHEDKAKTEDPAHSAVAAAEADGEAAAKAEEARPHATNKGVAITTEGYIATAMKKEVTLTHAQIAIVQSLAGREINVCSVRTTDGKICQPYGLAISEDNFIVISDVGKHCIYIFNPECVMVRQLGKKGKGAKQFRSPYHLTISPSREILVADYDNHVIKVFDFKANLKFQFGGLGKDLGKLNHPMGVITDKFGHIIVADRDNHRVQMFNRYGCFTTTLVEDTQKGGMDIRPEDVAITGHCQLIVLLKGIEGEDFSEIRIYQYGPSRWIQDGQLNLDKDQLMLLRKSVGSVQLLAQSTALLPRGKNLPGLSEVPTPRSNAPSRAGSIVPSAASPSPAPSSASRQGENSTGGTTADQQQGEAGGPSKLCVIL